MIEAKFLNREHEITNLELKITQQEQKLGKELLKLTKLCEVLQHHEEMLKIDVKQRERG